MNEGPTEMYFMKRTVYRNDVKSDKNWTFGLGNSGESTQFL